MNMSWNEEASGKDMTEEGGLTTSTWPSAGAPRVSIARKQASTRTRSRAHARVTYSQSAAHVKVKHTAERRNQVIR
jgi:hypothetical protein